MRRSPVRWWVAVGIAVATQAPLIGQVPTIAPSPLVRAPTIQPPPAGEIEVLPVRGNIYALIGAGANIVASVGPDGVMLIDAGTAAMSDKVDRGAGTGPTRVVRAGTSRSRSGGVLKRDRRSSIATSSRRRSRFATSSTPDPLPITSAATRSCATRAARSQAETSPATSAIQARGRPFSPMRTCSCGWATSPRDSRRLRPTRCRRTLIFNDSYKLSHFFNGEGVQLLHMPKANTDGDSIVYFRGSDVIALGDLMATESYPVFDVEKGGSINGIIDGLNAVLDLAITEFRLEGGTMMVPGHGRIVDSGDVAYYRDMLTIIRDRIQDMVTKEMTLDEVKAAKPTADYDTEYGKTPGWTSDMFIEAVYKSLGGGRTPPRATSTREAGSR